MDDETFNKLASSLYTAGLEDGYRIGRRLGKKEVDDLIAHCRALKYRHTKAGELARKELKALNK